MEIFLIILLIFSIATHILNASVRKIANCAVYQKSSMVTENDLKLEVGIYGLRLDQKKIEEIEGLVRNVIKSKSRVTHICINSQQLLKMDEITMIPGEIYPENNLRVVEINACNLNFMSRELCCGTHATNTRQLLDFCIVDVKSGTRGGYIFYGITGTKAELAHLNGNQILDDVDKIKLDLQNGKSKIENLLSRVQQLRKKIEQKSRNFIIPYTVKMSCLNILDTIFNEIRHISKENLK